MFGRYVFRQALASYLMVVISLTAILWIATALRQLSSLTSDGQNIFVFLYITALTLPSLVAMIAPIALLIVTLFTLSRLNGDSELIVVAASGATVWKAGRPLLYLSFIVVLIVAAGNFYLIPWSTRTLLHYFVQLRSDLISQVLQPGEFSKLEPGLTMHIGGRKKNGDITGLVLYDARNPKEILTYVAETGQVYKSGQDATLVMRTGQILQRGETGEDISIIEFASYFIDLSQFSEKTSTVEVLKPRARYLSELINLQPKDLKGIGNPGLIRAELHDRFATLLYPVAFVLIAIAYLGVARTNRQSRTASMVTAFSLAALLRIAGIAASNIVAVNAAATASVYLLPGGAILIAAIIAHRQMSPRRQGRIGKLLDLASGAIWPILIWPIRRFSPASPVNLSNSNAPTRGRRAASR